MRRLFAEVSALTFVALIAGAAEGQIQLLPGPQRLVSTAPKFVAKADFNNDQIDDVAVNNTTSNQVTILLGAAGSNSFGSLNNFNIGRTLHGLAAGNLNSDTNQDIAVTDFIDDKVFWPFGAGNGTFQGLTNYSKVGLYPVDVAIGNFDDARRNDLAVLDQGQRKVSVLLNLGQNKGFPPKATADFAVGPKPKRVITARLNGDAFDDIVTVNTGTAGADSVSLLMNKGSGTFTVPAPAYVVGAGAVDVVAGKFHVLVKDDSNALDLVALNGNLATQQTSFSLSILLNDGTGLFTSQPPVQLNCPASINGVPIFCQPNFIAAGDFDGDGILDLAVTVFTNPQNNVSSASTSGLVVAFKGDGIGGFTFADQVTVGLNPQGIVSGDFTGRGLDTSANKIAIDDLAIAEQGSLSVRIITSQAPAKLPNGGSCHLGQQCESNSCVDGVCCGSSSCPAGQFCDIPTSAGTCSLPASPATACTDNHQCASGFCVDGFCCTSPQCGTGLFCNTGTCSPPADLGTPCNSANASGGADQCASGHCTDGVCCQDDRCTAGEACNIPGLEGTCNSKLPIGTACMVDAQCAAPTPGGTTGFCTDGFCCVLPLCPEGQACNIPPAQGFCSLAPTSTPTPTRTPTPQPNGSSCTSGTQCSSSFCVDLTCCTSASCPSVGGVAQFCNIFDSPGTCAPKKTTGACGSDQDCVSGNCQAGSPSTCQGTRTPTPTPTPRPGDPCASNSQCPPGFSCSTSEFVCCNTTSCPTGFSCKVASNPGFCTSLPTPTPSSTPLPPLGSPCSSPDQCESGFCTDGFCCDEDSPCPVSGDRCDITGSEGTCSPPGNEGAPCTKNTDCNALLECDRASGTCLIPLPTPTFPAPTPTTGSGITTSTSSSGGCSINNGTDGSTAWLLAALPLLFGMRRYRLQGARVRRRRDGR